MIRAWVIVGGNNLMNRGISLPPQQYVGDYTADSIPNAANFYPGQWIEWKLQPGRSVFLVCVEMPLGV